MHLHADLYPRGHSDAHWTKLTEVIDTSSDYPIQLFYFENDCENIFSQLNMIFS